MSNFLWIFPSYAPDPFPFGPFAVLREKYGVSLTLSMPKKVQKTILTRGGPLRQRC
jgi:hypothetical protein